MAYGTSSNRVTSTTVGIPPLEILKIQLLNRRDKVLDAIEQQEVRMAKTKDKDNPAYETIAAIKSFFYAIEPYVKRWLEEEDYTELKSRLTSQQYTDYLSAFRLMNTLLDEKRIIRLDLEREYDTTNVEEENNVKGL